MRATELVGVREMVPVTMPEPEPASGQVVVRVAAVGICGSDLAAFRGVHPRMVPPLVLGHEFAGEIVATGQGVRNDLVGRRVAVDPLVTCGECEACTADRPNICRRYRMIGCRPGLPGAFAELVALDADMTWELPDDCSYVSGALVQPLAVSHHAVIHRARLQPGEQVLIIGAGPVGLGALMLALAEGATVTVTDLDPYRLEAAAQLGAHRTIRADRGGSEVGETGEPSVVLECAGGRQSQTLAAATAWCRPGGRIVIVGNFAAAAAGVDPVAVKVKELTVLGSQAYVDSFGEVIEMVRSHRLEPTKLVSHVLPLNDPAAGLELLDDTTAQKIKIVMTAPDHAAPAGSLP